jgi:hypothetical protein
MSGGALRALWCLALALAGCSETTVTTPLPTQAEWDSARIWLAALRAGEPKTPFGAVVRVTLREPYTRKTFEARGALAVDPHRALRMILVGPGGATAIDVWATKEQWRFEVPAASVLRRGGSEDDPSLPMGFFRWWFLGPTDGRLLTSVAPRHSENGSAQRLVLREGGATIDLTDRRREGRHLLSASRLAADGVDRIEFEGASFAMGKGDHATYDEESSGVHVEVTVEAPADAPDPEAFTDPDVAARAARNTNGDVKASPE